MRSILTGVVILITALAVVASAPEDDPSVELLTSFPGPFFFLPNGESSAEFFVMVEASRSAFPPEGAWTEFFEVEVNFSRNQATSTRSVLGRISRLDPDSENLRVLSTTTAQVSVLNQATMILADNESLTSCAMERCRKLYRVSFSKRGLGAIQTNWFIRAGIDWTQDGLEVPESAILYFDLGAP